MKKVLRYTVRIIFYGDVTYLRLDNSGWYRSSEPDPKLCHEREDSTSLLHELEKARETWPGVSFPHSQIDIAQVDMTEHYLRELQLLRDKTKDLEALLGLGGPSTPKPSCGDPEGVGCEHDPSDMDCLCPCHGKTCRCGHPMESHFGTVHRCFACSCREFERDV